MLFTSFLAVLIGIVSNSLWRWAAGLNMNRLETMNARQNIREGVFGLRRIVIGLQADPETVAGTEEARQV